MRERARVLLNSLSLCGMHDGGWSAKVLFLHQLQLSSHSELCSTYVPFAFKDVWQDSSHIWSNFAFSVHLWQFIERGSNVLSAALSTQLPWFTFPICLSQTALSREWLEERRPFNSTTTNLALKSIYIKQNKISALTDILTTFHEKEYVASNISLFLFKNYSYMNIQEKMNVSRHVSRQTLLSLFNNKVFFLTSWTFVCYKTHQKQNHPSWLWLRVSYLYLLSPSSSPACKYHTV